MIKLKSFPIINQETPYTCEYASVRMLSLFLKGKTPTEKEMARGILFNLVKGAPPWHFVKIFKKYLPDYFLRQENPPREEITNIIFRQIESGIPVPVMYLALNEDKSQKVLHYAVLTGIDEQKTKVALANPFGYEEVFEMEDFLDKMAFKDYEGKPFLIQIAMMLGLLRKNTIFLIQKCR